MCMFLCRFYGKILFPITITYKLDAARKLISLAPLIYYGWSSVIKLLIISLFVTEKK